MQYFPLVSIYEEYCIMIAYMNIVGSKNKKHRGGSTQYSGLGQYNVHGEYYGPDTAPSVFLILIPVEE